LGLLLNQAPNKNHINFGLAEIFVIKRPPAKMAVSDDTKTDLLALKKGSMDSTLNRPQK
jgi:predicted acetyltransferase